MRLSLVICTRNRGRRLDACLRAVAAMEVTSDFELILVDNGSTDETTDILTDFSESAPFATRICHEPIPGLARARNRGWRAARGDIIAFTDDDCYVAPDYGRKVLELFASNPSIGFFGGRILLHDPADLPITILNRQTFREFPPRTFIHAGAVQGANFGARRAALDQSGGFDERLGAGTPYPSEDIELIGRLSALGWQGCYSPEPTVSHHHGRRSLSEGAALNRGYDAGRGAYYACMLQHRDMRILTLRAWMRLIRVQKSSKTAREVWAAGNFLIASAFSSFIGHSTPFGPSD